MNAQSALWHPFANMAELAAGELVVDSADGCWITDENGKRYLDGTASLWYCNVGHGRRDIAEAVAQQIKKLDAFSIFSYYTNRPAMELADRLSALAPMKDAKIFLTCGGGEAIDTAVKIARKFHVEHGKPRRMHVLSRQGSYHGTNGIGTALAGIEANREGFGSYMPDSSRVEYGSLTSLQASIDTIGAENIAAYVFEPVIGAGGVLSPPEGYIEGAVEMCKRHGILTIADSVIGGFGRLGTWFGVERWKVEPDLIAFAKGVTSGYLPLGGVAVASHVAEPFWTGRGKALNHGPTYSGHPASCAAALVNLGILENEDLLERSRKFEEVLKDALVAQLGNSRKVKEIRAGVGLMAGVVLADDALAQFPDATLRVQKAARDSGVIVRGLGGGVVAMSPPLVITESEIDILVGSLAGAIDRVTQ